MIFCILMLTKCITPKVTHLNPNPSTNKNKLLQLTKKQTQNCNLTINEPKYAPATDR